MNTLQILILAVSAVAALAGLIWFLNSEKADFLFATDVKSALSKKDLFTFQRRARKFCAWLGYSKCMINQNDFDRHDVILLLNRKDHKVDKEGSSTEAYLLQLTERFREDVLAGFEQYFYTITYKVSYQDNEVRTYSYSIQTSEQVGL